MTNVVLTKKYKGREAGAISRTSPKARRPRSKPSALVKS
jgi:hypothetical protein